MATIKLKKAISLIEVIVSLVIISISITGITATFFWMQDRNLIAQRHLQAVDFTKETLEELLQKDFSDTVLTIGNHTIESFLALPSCTLKDKFSATRSYRVDLIAEGKQIKVTINWSEEGKILSEELCGLVIQK